MAATARKKEVLKESIFGEVKGSVTKRRRERGGGGISFGVERKGGSPEEGRNARVKRWLCGTAEDAGECWMMDDCSKRGGEIFYRLACERRVLLRGMAKFPISVGAFHRGQRDVKGGDGRCKGVSGASGASGGAVGCCGNEDGNRRGIDGGNQRGSMRLKRPEVPMDKGSPLCTSP
jgi:hypothetical protein